MYNDNGLKGDKWSKIAYPGEIVYPDRVDFNTGYWIMNYFNYIGNGVFSNKIGRVINSNLKNSKEIDFKVELNRVRQVVSKIEKREDDIIKYWSGKSIVEIIMCMSLKLLVKYESSEGMKVRITSILTKAINDSYIIATYYKYFYDIPRPIQLDEKINCRIDTPKSPSYPSVYLATMATAIEILVYYFPKERKKLLMIQQQLGESRLYGGIHFRKDLYDGVKLGKQIGKEIILQVSKELDVKVRVIDKF